MLAGTVCLGTVCLIRRGGKCLLLNGCVCEYIPVLPVCVSYTCGSLHIYPVLQEKARVSYN